MQLLSETYLEFVHGSSSKFYALVLVADGGTFSVAFNYGKIGSPRGWGMKLEAAPEAKARAKFAALVAEKTGEGYVERPRPAILAYPMPAGSTSRVAPAMAAATPTTPAGLPPVFPAQLAHRVDGLGEVLANPSAYVVEEKYDGMRGLVALGPEGVVAIRNRYGQDKGRIANAPALREALIALAAGRPELWAGTVLDGELVGESWSDTMHLMGSAGQVSDGLRFVVFDLPYLAGVDLRPLPLRTRKARLAALAVEFAAPIELAPSLAPAPTLAEQVWAAGGEGLVTKPLDAPYAPGDRSTWGKRKLVETDDVVILGFTAGQGQFADTVGAIVAGQYRDGALVEVGEVSGFSVAQRRSFDASWIGRVIEISHGPRTRAGKYLSAQWVRERPDKAPTDCTW